MAANPESYFGSERIVAAAIKQNGEIFALPAPDRHHNVMAYMREFLGEKYTPPEPMQQGFLTSKGRFVRRKEARMIAIDSGQIDKTPHVELFSEDVW